uniref:Uncharacterized protein n=1 Tax=Setaria digitata TaxID=48799 RepID=A0A915PLZ3_9BILA
MWYTWAVVIVLTSCCILSATACKIDIKMQSQTNMPFQVQIYVPSIRTKTERLLIKRKNQVRRVTIKGKYCDDEHWIFKTWKKKDNKWIPAKENKAKLEGNGSFDLIVSDDFVPRIGNRFAVICSEGQC